MSESIPSLEAYAAHLEGRGRLVRVGGEPWMLANRRLTPAVPPHRMGPVDRAEVRRALRQSGAIAALWTDAWDTSPGPWWWVCCDDRKYDFPSVRSKKRRTSVRKGLKQCEVRRLDVAELAAVGHDVYVAAFDRYGSGSDPMSQEAFVADVRRNAEYPGRETWGALVDGALAAYATCIVIDDMVNVSASKSVPALLKYRPNDALRFELTRHYLCDRGMAYVTGGSRVLQHDTNVQDFVETLGYRRIHCPLRLEMRGGIELAVRFGVRRWARMLGMARWRPALLDRIEALDMAYGIARVCAAEFP